MFNFKLNYNTIKNNSIKNRNRFCLNNPIFPTDIQNTTTTVFDWIEISRQKVVNKNKKKKKAYKIMKPI